MKSIIISLIFSIIMAQSNQFIQNSEVPDEISTWHNFFIKSNYAVNQYYLNSDADYAFSGIYYAIEHPYEFRNNFKFRISQEDYELDVWDNYENIYFFYQYRVDMENDGSWEQDWTGNELLELEHTYPEPAGTSESHTIHLQLRYSSLLGEVFTINQYIPVTIFAEPQVYSDTDGNLLVQPYQGGCSEQSPLLIVEGIDPLNRNYPNLYYNKVYDFLEDDLPSGIYNPFFLNFVDGGTDLRDNAQIVLDALELVHETCPDTSITLIGISMGGVICRYALAYAEEQNEQHNVSVYFSMDSPHQGAHINYSLQEVVYQLDPGISEFVSKCQQMFSSTAAKQLMKENIYDPPTMNGHGVLFNEFFDELNQLNGDGYPHKTVNVAISNGAMSATYGSSYLDEPLVSLDAEALGLAETYAYIGSTAEDTGPGAKIENFKGTFWTRLDYLWLHLADFELELHYDPVYIPTSSALDLKNITYDADFNITDYESTGFHYLIFQDSGCFHGDFTDHTKSQVLEFLINTPSKVTMMNVLDGENIPDTFLEIIETGELISSGSSISLLVGEEYTIRPVDVDVPERQLMHNCWNYDENCITNSHSFEVQYATAPRQAIFEEYFDLYFDTSMNNEYFIQNPWCLTNQCCNSGALDQIVDLEGGQLHYKVFMNEVQDGQLADPVYHLTTEEFMHDEESNLDYRFLNWAAYTADHNPITDELVVFENSSQAIDCQVQFSRDLIDFPGVYIKPEYDPKIMVIFGAPANISIKISDPWYYNESSQQHEQKDIFLQNEQYSLFRNEYEVSAPGFICDQDQLFPFSHWTGTNVTIIDENQRITFIEFLADNAELQAVYETEGIPLNASSVWHITDTDWLDIPSGSILNFSENSILQIDGELNIAGTENDPVSFLGTGLTLNLSGYSDIQYLNLDNFGSIIVDYEPYQGSLTMSNSQLRYGSGINVSASDQPGPIFENCTIENIVSITAEDNAQVVFQESELYNIGLGIQLSENSRLVMNQVDYTANSNWAILADSSHIYMNNSTIRTGNNGIHSSGFAILDLENSNLYGTDQNGFGVYLDESRLTAVYSAIGNFDTGAWLDSGNSELEFTSTLEHCTFAYNNVGFYWNAPDPDDHNHYPIELDINHTILTSFITTHTAVNLQGHWEYNYPTIVGDSFDPMFVDPNSNEFHLQSDSPCIDAGDPDEIESDYSSADIGAYSYHKMLGDVVPDGEINVLDIAVIVDHLQTSIPLTANQIHCADTNVDGTIDILDLVIIADCIVSDCTYMGDVPKLFSCGTAEIVIGQFTELTRGDEDNLMISLVSDSEIRGFQFEFMFDPEEFNLDEVLLTPESDGFFLRYNQETPGVINILAYPVDDFMILPGQHDVLEISFFNLGRRQSEIDLDTVSAVVAGIQGRPLTISNSNPVIPEQITLAVPYPNPFNPSTNVRFSLPEQQVLSMGLYDIGGRLIKEVIESGSAYPAGTHNITLECSDLASGMYLIQLKTDRKVLSRKVMLLK